MKVNVRFHCQELVGNIRSGDYELPDGATITDLIDEAQRIANEILNEQQKDYLAFMINGQAAVWETVLKDGDMIRVLYKIVGG